MVSPSTEAERDVLEAPAKAPPLRVLLTGAKTALGPATLPEPIRQAGRMGTLRSLG